MDRAFEPVPALNAKHRCANAVDTGAHLDEAIRDISDLGLSCGVLDHGLPLSERRGEQHVVRGADRDLGKDDMGAMQPLRRLGKTYPPSISISAPSDFSPVKCRSTGRVPMAQPPGSDTLATPMRAMSGPRAQSFARIRETIS